VLAVLLLSSEAKVPFRKVRAVRSEGNGAGGVAADPSTRSTDPFVGVSYEKPTWFGWARLRRSAERGATVETAMSTTAYIDICRHVPDL
jgi:hypothetical protein